MNDMATYSEQTDEQLAVAMKDGDGRAFDHIVLRHFDSLVGYFVTRVSDHALAEDLAQETLLRVYACGERYADQGTFGGWLWCIAGNLLRDTYRRRSCNTIDQSVSGHCADGTNLLAEVAGRSLDPSARSTRDEAYGLVHGELEKLPEEQRQAFTLCCIDGLKVREAAAAMGVGVPTIKGRLRLARQKMTEALAGPLAVPVAA